MDINAYYNTPGINKRLSVATLQGQHAYTLDVDIRKGKLITGGFGKKIYEAEWIDQEGSPIVLIEIKGDNVSTEAMLYVTLDNPHIIKTYGLVDPNGHETDLNSIFILQEYATDGDLSNLLANRYFIPNQNVLLEIFIQIAEAMVFLSKNDIIHGDLACRNVVVFKTHPHDPKRNLVKVIDFGLTRDNSKTLDTKIEIPVRYAAPENLRSKGQSGSSEKSDVYSFAVLMHEACSFGKIPYEYINDDEEVCQQKLNGKRLTQPEECNSTIWKLMNQCWNVRPSDRPSFQTIHTQLKNIQNIESSSSHSNSSLSSSPRIKENPRLFQIEYAICPNCRLRYTDYDSHLNNCSEQELTCYKCGEQYRRASYDYHTENCVDLSNETNNTRSLANLSSSEELDQDRYFNQINSRRSPVSLQSKDRSSSHYSLDTNHLHRLPPINTRSRYNSSDQPKTNNYISEEKPFPSHRTSISQKPVNQLVTSIREPPLQSNPTQLPCEICAKLIDASQFHTHQRQCKEKDQKRLIIKAKELGKQPTIKEIKCIYCHQNCLIREVEKHESICLFNPENVPPSKQEKLPTIKNKQELSGFRKFLSSIWPFKKK